MLFVDIIRTLAATAAEGNAEQGLDENPSGDEDEQAECCGNFIDGGSYNLSSTGGGISVICTKTASVEWDVRTVKGSIKSNLPIRSKQHRPLFNNFQSLLGTSNKGQATVHLSTFSGKIQIKHQIPKEW